MLHRFSADPKLCALTPNGHLEMNPIGGGRINLEDESRKSSVTSLGKSSLEQRSFSLVRAKCQTYVKPTILQVSG